MKARTSRERKLRRYLERMCETRPQDYAPPCLERWHNRNCMRQYARIRNDRPIPVMPARVWCRKDMSRVLQEARAEAVERYADLFKLID